MQKIGLFTGSFDPITKGHLDLIERASGLFDLLYVGIFSNPSKKGYFKMEQREQFVQTAITHLPNVHVITSSDRLAVDLARDYQVTHLVRGLRNGHDLDYEVNMEFYNHSLNEHLETIYLSTKPAYREISSSRIRELLAFQAPIGAYVPECVAKGILHNEKK